MSQFKPQPTRQFLKTIGPKVLNVALLISGFLFGREFYRLGHDYQLDISRMPKITVAEDGFTHASGPPLSVATNGRMKGARFHRYATHFNGVIEFPNGKPIDYRLKATMKEWENELPGPIAAQLDSKKSITITSDVLAKFKMAPDGSFTARCEGYYFVGKLWLKNPKDFPKDGYISVIMN
jgi:hypothetical protein